MWPLPASEFTDHLTAWAAAIAALGTVAAVLIALYRDTWRARRRRPQLTLSFADPAETHGTHLGPGVRDLLPGVRLRVSNATGRDTATDVEVLLSTWWRSADSEEWTQGLDYRPLPWANEYESGIDVTRVAIPPGVARQVEFLRFGRPRDVQRVIEREVRAVEFPPELSDDERPEPWVQDFALLVAPPFEASSMLLIAEHLTYRLRLVATARDVDATTYDAVLRVSAEWEDDDRETAAVGFSADWSDGLKRAASTHAPFRV